jgi:hypothetical protein
MDGATVRRHTPPSYGPQWAIFFLLVIAGITIQKVNERIAFKHVQMVRNYEGQGSPWFMVLRMPEIPSAVKDVDVAQRALLARLHVLQREGFHPVLLSDIHRHITKGTPLPSRPVVIVWDPGHRHTFDMLSPVIKGKKVPAVWLTDGGALDNSDRRYVSKHATRLMVKSGLWDVGVYHEGKPVQIHNHEEGVWTFADKPEQAWASAAGVFAVNPATSLQGLNRLNVNSNWSANEFIDRVLAELPVEGPVKLSARQIRNHQWGLSVPATAPAPPTFTLESNLEKRGNTISWLGTRGLYDGDLTITMQDLSGEAWLLLRSDEHLGESVRVGFTENLVLLEQEQQHFSRRLTAASAPGVGILNTPFTSKITMDGTRIAIDVNGKRVLNYDGLQPNQSKQGVMRITVYDKLRGTARAAGVAMAFNPRLETPEKQGASQ